MTEPKIVQVHDLTFELMISEEEVQRRVAEMGKLLEEKYRDKNPLFLGVLNGSFVFTADLTRAFGGVCEVSFIKLSSYSGLASTGTVATVIGLTVDVENRHVIIVEDIIDTGKTMHEFLPTLQKMNPASVAFATFLLKPEAVQYDFPIDYIGFEIPNKFVVGYGMDYNEQARNLRGIYQLK
ncbi:MAG: hypoxanthine phosphoribosyltransferase [Bacteroidota bacterium]